MFGKGFEPSTPGVAARCSTTELAVVLQSRPLSEPATERERAKGTTRRAETDDWTPKTQKSLPEGLSRKAFESNAFSRSDR